MVKHLKIPGGIGWSKDPQSHKKNRGTCVQQSSQAQKWGSQMKIVTLGASFLCCVAKNYELLCDHVTIFLAGVH